jgi:hypothetical protein
MRATLPKAKRQANVRTAEGCDFTIAKLAFITKEEECKLLFILYSLANFVQCMRNAFLVIVGSNLVIVLQKPCLMLMDLVFCLFRASIENEARAEEQREGEGACFVGPLLAAFR